jgi:hypothetical protein
MISIPPGFGIKIWSIPKTIWICVTNRLKGASSYQISRIKEYLYAYTVMATKRKSIEYYKKAIEKTDKYVFHTSTLWINSDCQTGTNPIRASFIRKCKQNEMIHFEGGLVCKWDCPQEYEDILSPRYEMADYLTNTKQSLFVFNTPAVLRCHGWKLGEYFAMGKAIITTPLSNMLPFNFENGVNCLIVRDDIELDAAISRLAKDKDLVKKLEKSSQVIYDRFSSPIQVVNSIDRSLGL